LALLCVGAAFGIPWPHYPMDSIHPIGNSWGVYQNYGSPYCHNGDDIMTTALCPAVAVRAGYVKKIWLGGSPMYNGVTVGDSAGAGFCSGYMYYHIDNSTIRVQEGDTIRIGDTLGLIATWSVANFHHDHFSKNHNSGVIWPAYGTFYKNPLVEFVPDYDSTTPIFLDAYSGQRFAICRNNTSNYQSKDSVYGTVDLICRLEDRINHRVWKVAVYKIMYSIRDSFGPYVQPLALALQFSESIESYNAVQSRVVYKQDATCNSYCDYDSLNRRFYYIFTNTDGDSLFEATDSLAGWNTTTVPDGPYWVKVIASDEYGNTCADSMLVRVKNGNARHDVGAIAITAPTGAVDSGTVVIPRAVIGNFGASIETFSLRFAIGAFYSHDTILTLSAGASDTAEFAAWVAGPLGILMTRCTTMLTGDVDPENDCCEDSVLVIPYSAVAEPSDFAPAAQGLTLGDATPNPFRGQVSVVYALAQGSHARLRVYGADGRLVRCLDEGVKKPGRYHSVWDGRDDRGRFAPPGVYVCRLDAGSAHAARVMLMLP
jgi:hypothetical protein